MPEFTIRMPDEFKDEEKQTVPFYFRIEKDQFGQLKKLCSSSKINMTALVRNIIKDYLLYVDSKLSN
jgi:hypothetical protein